MDSNLLVCLKYYWIFSIEITEIYLVFVKKINFLINFLKVFLRFNEDHSDYQDWVRIKWKKSEFYQILFTELNCHFKS